MTVLTYQRSLFQVHNTNIFGLGWNKNKYRQVATINPPQNFDTLSYPRVGL